MATDSERARVEHVYSHYERKARDWDSSNPGNRANHSLRMRAIDELLTAHFRRPRASARVVDLGCGPGAAMDLLAELGFSRGRMVGIDLQFDRLRPPQPGGPWFVSADGRTLPVRQGSVELVMMSTLFSSVLDDAIAARIADAVAACLHPQGVLIWYDMRYPSPANKSVRPFRRSAIAGLFPGFRLFVKPTTVLPPIARRLGSRGATLVPHMARVPPLCSHNLVLLQRC